MDRHTGKSCAIYTSPKRTGRCLRPQPTDANLAIALPRAVNALSAEKGFKHREADPLPIQIARAKRMHTHTLKVGECE
eukprot:9259712-Alexandrium_andersonii.AAC.1